VRSPLDAHIDMQSQQSFPADLVEPKSGNILNSIALDVGWPENVSSGYYLCCVFLFRFNRLACCSSVSRSDFLVLKSKFAACAKDNSINYHLRMLHGRVVCLLSSSGIIIVVIID